MHATHTTLDNTRAVQSRDIPTSWESRSTRNESTLVLSLSLPHSDPESTCIYSTIVGLQQIFCKRYFVQRVPETFLHTNRPLTANRAGLEYLGTGLLWTYLPKYSSTSTVFVLSTEGHRTTSKGHLEAASVPVLGRPGMWAKIPKSAKAILIMSLK